MTIENAQKITYIPVKDLVLWTENPRDTISSTASNEDIIKNALQNWELKKLAKMMGLCFDFSEIPTVVYHDANPVVYDGNRRVILAMLKLHIYDIETDFSIPYVPDTIPCNVCEEDIALRNIYRKHVNNGSWKPLERDRFCNKHMKESPSSFLIIDDATGFISSNPELNKVFVKEEILSIENIEKLGFSTTGNKFRTRHSKADTKQIFDDILTLVQLKEITTRKHRGKLIDILPDNSKKLIEKDKKNNLKAIEFTHAEKEIKEKRVTRRAKQNTEVQFFSGKLLLKPGNINNLYRDISDLYSYYDNAIKEKKISKSFIGIIRMSLRLITELASKDENHSKIDNFIKENFAEAKRGLSKNEKTFLSNNNVTENSIISLLHTGAHNYEAALNIDQTIAISILIGKILTLKFGKNSE